VSFRNGAFSDVRFRIALEGVTSIALNESGAVAAAGAADGTIYLLDALDGRILTPLKGHSDVVTGVCFGANGQLLASSSDDGSVLIRDVRDGAVLRNLRQGRAELFAVAVDSSAELVAAGGASKKLYIWDRMSGTLVHCIDVGDEIVAVALAPDGRLVGAGRSVGTASVWDISTGEHVLTTGHHGGPVNSLVFGAGDVIVASSSVGRTARSWELHDNRAGSRLAGDMGTAGALVYSPDGNVAASCAAQDRVEVWDTATGERLQSLPAPDLRLQALAVDNEHGVIVAAGDPQAIRCWDLPGGRERWTVHGHSRWVKAARLTSDGAQVACCADDERIHIWGTRTAVPGPDLVGHEGHVRDLQTNPRDPAAAYSGGDDRTVIAWDLDRIEVVERLSAHDGAVWAVAVSPDGDLLAAGTITGSISVWRLSQRARKADFGAHSGPVRSLAFDATGRWLVSASDDRSLRVWDVNEVVNSSDTPGPKATGQGHDGRIWSVRCSPRRDLIVTASEDGTVRLWSLKHAREVGRGTEHQGAVWSAVFGPDGRMVVSGGSDGAVRLWSVSAWASFLAAKSLRHDRVLGEHDGWVRSVAFSRDGNTVVSGSHDGTVAVWELPTGEHRVLPVLRPYDGVDVTDATGLTVAERDSLRALGARTSEAEHIPLP
jgi:WD40 repeat protein